jgi:hypothetical protein
MTEKEAREERLAAALRENLRKRKAQARDLSGIPAKAGPQTEPERRAKKS